MASKIISYDTQIETTTMKATGLADLVLWIEQARTLIDRVRSVAKHDKGFAALFGQYSIRYHSPDWDDDTSNGMVYLVQAQQDMLAEILKASEQWDVELHGQARERS
jgi:hypothetical protein